MAPGPVDDDAVGQLVEPGDQGAHPGAVQRHRLHLLLAIVEHQQFGHRRPPWVSAGAPWTAENVGMASQMAWMFRPACMTARSGLMMAVLARPLRSQRSSSLPGAAATTAAPRLRSSFRCASLSGDELISAKRFATISSKRRP